MDINSYCEELPIINGVLYPDGNFEKVNIITDENWKRTIQQNQIKTVFPFSDDTVYSSIIVQSGIICNDLNCKAVCGEGSYGGDGFVLLKNILTDKIVCLASFDNSNPFISIQRNQNGFIVTNNCYEKWYFDISDTDNVKISIIEQGLL